MGELYCVLWVGPGDVPLVGVKFASPEVSMAPAGALGGTGLPFICPFKEERHEGEVFKGGVSGAGTEHNSGLHFKKKNDSFSSKSSEKLSEFHHALGLRRVQPKRYTLLCGH